MQVTNDIDQFLQAAEGGHINACVGEHSDQTYKVELFATDAAAGHVLLDARTKRAAQIEVTTWLADRGWQPTERWGVDADDEAADVLSYRRFRKS